MLAALFDEASGQRNGRFLLRRGTVITLGAVNYRSRHRAALVGRQEVQTRFLWVREHVRPNDFLLFAGRGTHSIVNVYVAYFSASQFAGGRSLASLAVGQ